MKAMTFNDWADAGYYVKKGEKSAGTNGKGVATFTRDQVDNDREPVRKDVDGPQEDTDPVDPLQDVEDDE
jgi:hypothetical protein